MLLDTLPLSDEGRRLAESLFGAQSAYDHYRRWKDARALELLKRSFCNDIVLEKERGYNVLRIHRVQLLNNVMRVHAGRERWLEAMTLGHALLTHLEIPERDELAKLPPPWDRGWAGGFAGIPVELVNAMHAQIAAEVVRGLEQAAMGETSRGEIVAMLQPLRSERNGSQAGLWIDFQLVRFDSESGDPFAAAIPVWRRGAFPSEPLWRSVAECSLTLLREIMNGENRQRGHPRQRGQRSRSGSQGVGRSCGPVAIDLSTADGTIPTDTSSGPTGRDGRSGRKGARWNWGRRSDLNGY
jgi:hypothetical protein